MNIMHTNNPTINKRHQLLKMALTSLKRREDFNNIIDSAAMPPDILTIAPPHRFKHIKIGIIGAGLAGLASAYELSKLGCDITLFEGDNQRIGGRVYTHYFSEDDYGELGAMHIPVSHEATWHYIDRFRLNTIPSVQHSLNDILYVKNIRIRGDNIQNEIMMRLYPHFQLNEWEFRTPLAKLQEYVYNQALLHLTRFERDQLLRIQQHYSPTINYLDSINFYQASHNLGFSDDGVYLLNSTMGLERGLFYNSYLSLLKEMYAAHFSYLYQIEGGNSQLPHAFYNVLSQKSNVTFKLGHRVTGIYLDHQAIDPVRLRYTHQGRDSSETFDFIICAIPFSSLRLVDIQPQFSNRKMQAIRQVNYTAAQKTLFLCKERFWEQNRQNPVLGGSVITDLTVSSLWYPSIPPTSDYGVLVASYNVEQDAIRIGNLPDDERIYMMKREIERIHGLRPNALDDIVIATKTMDWNRHAFSLGGFCWYKPDQTSLFAYASVTPEFNNRVFFAGEHVSPYHAWMQGALQSGANAANQIAMELVASGPFVPTY